MEKNDREEDEEEIDPTESEQFKIAEDYGSAVVPKRFPRTLVIAISTHGTIRRGEHDFKVPDGITLVKVNAVIPSVCNIITSEDMKTTADFITEEISKTPVLDAKNLVELSREIKDDIVEKVKASKLRTEAYVRQERKAGETESLLDELAFLNSFARGYSVIDATGSEMVNKHYLRQNKVALNPTGDWQINALNIEGQPDLLNEVEKANGRRSTRFSDPEITFEELVNFCISMGSSRFLVFDFSCADVTDEDGSAVFSEDERSRRHFANDALKEGVLYGGKTKKSKRKRKSKNTLKRSNKKRRSRKITRRRRYKVK